MSGGQPEEERRENGGAPSSAFARRAKRISDLRVRTSAHDLSSWNVSFLDDIKPLPEGVEGAPASRAAESG
jgi:hypothetical protein